MRIEQDRNAYKLNWVVLAFTLAHIAASFLYEPVLFGSAALGALTSGEFANIATVLASKLIGALLIWLFWRALIRLFAGAYPKSAVISFFILFAVSLAVIAIVYPKNYAYETDNLFLYKSALLYHPAFWHHYLTSSFFAGCYMLLPHPVSLMLVQSAFYCALIASLFAQLSARFGAGRAWPVFLLLLIPVSYYVQFSPYRNCLYTILCMFACSELLFFWLDQAPPPLSRQIRLAAVFSLIAVWRSEGILLFVLLPLGYWLGCRMSLRKILLFTAASAAFALLLGLPQSIGMAQTGQDGNYKIVSTMNPLKDIYNAEDFSLEYPGGEADAAQIERVVPRALLQEYGLDGYRAFNAANGRGINDAGRTREQVNVYMGAYARLVLHNLPAFIRAQLVRTLEALKFPQVIRAIEFKGEHTELPEPKVASKSADTIADTQGLLAQGAFWRANTENNAGDVQESLNELLREFQYQYSTRMYRVSNLLRALLPFAAIAVALFAGRRKRSIFPILVLLVLAAELAAVILMAPEGRTAYYYPVLFCGYLFVLILAPFCLEKPIKREETARHTTKRRFKNERVETIQLNMQLAESAEEVEVEMKKQP